MSLVFPGPNSLMHVPSWLKIAFCLCDVTTTGQLCLETVVRLISAKDGANHEQHMG